MLSLSLSSGWLTQAASETYRPSFASVSPPLEQGGGEEGHGGEEGGEEEEELMSSTFGKAAATAAAVADKPAFENDDDGNGVRKEKEGLLEDLEVRAATVSSSSPSKAKKKGGAEIVDLNPALSDSAKKNVSLTFFYPSCLPAWGRRTESL